MQWAAAALVSACLSLDMSDNLGLQQMPSHYLLQLDVSQHICIPTHQASKPATYSLCACSAGCNAVTTARILRTSIMAAPHNSECKA